MAQKLIGPIQKLFIRDQAGSQMDLASTTTEELRARLPSFYHDATMRFTHESLGPLGKAMHGRNRVGLLGQSTPTISFLTKDISKTIDDRIHCLQHFVACTANRSLAFSTSLPFSRDCLPLLFCACCFLRLAHCFSSPETHLKSTLRTLDCRMFTCIHLFDLLVAILVHLANCDIPRRSRIRLVWH
jgi:hypothetical protein